MGVKMKIKLFFREIKFLYQKLTRGFSDRELWCLANTTAEFLIPRLKVFNKGKCGFPAGIKYNTWTKKLNCMIRAFELIARDDATWNFSSKEEQEVKQGLDLFRRYFFDLWD